MVDLITNVDVDQGSVYVCEQKASYLGVNLKLGKNAIFGNFLSRVNTFVY